LGRKGERVLHNLSEVSAKNTSIASRLTSKTDDKPFLDLSSHPGAVRSEIGHPFLKAPIQDDKKLAVCPASDLGLDSDHSKGNLRRPLDLQLGLVSQAHPKDSASLLMQYSREVLQNFLADSRWTQRVGDIEDQWIGL
jgi:hypothetical protein